MIDVVDEHEMGLKCTLTEFLKQDNTIRMLFALMQVSKHWSM